MARAYSEARGEYELAGMAAYSRDPRPYRVVCSCQAEPVARPGWYDAGCPYHGITSLIGKWEYLAEAEDFRRALMPGKAGKPTGPSNNKWGG